MDDRIKCYDISSAECVWEAHFEAGITSLRVFEDLVIAGLYNGHLILLDTLTGKVVMDRGYCEMKINCIDRH